MGVTARISARAEELQRQLQDSLSSKRLLTRRLSSLEMQIASLSDDSPHSGASVVSVVTRASAHLQTELEFLRERSREDFKRVRLAEEALIDMIKQRDEALRERDDARSKVALVRQK